MTARSRRLPAEWEPHAGTWLGWPHDDASWPPPVRERVERLLSQAAATIARGEPVHVACAGAAHARRVRELARAAGTPDARLRLHIVPTDDAWCRDYGPIGVCTAAGALAVQFRFDGWGGKYPHARDALAGARMAAALGLPSEPVPVVLEGGAIDGNGAGLLLATEQCLLHARDHRRIGRAGWERLLARHLGAREVLWLGRGLSGDDTDGHVDQCARFVAADAVLAAVADDPAHPDHDALAENLARLRAWRLADGRPLSITTVPLPAPLEHDGRWLPASHLNFYVANAAVLMPAFGGASDRVAADALANAFPGRAVVPLPCREVLIGGGAIHCLTQPVPACAVAQREPSPP